jgi:hypothetical protein
MQLLEVLWTDEIKNETFPIFLPNHLSRRHCVAKIRLETPSKTGIQPLKNQCFSAAFLHIGAFICRGISRVS